MALACCVTAQLAIVRATLRVPVRNADPAVPRPRRVTELVWTLLPALVLALVLAATWYAIQAHGADAGAAALRLRFERTL